MSYIHGVEQTNIDEFFSYLIIFWTGVSIYTSEIKWLVLRSLFGLYCNCK